MSPERQRPCRLTLWSMNADREVPVAMESRTCLRRGRYLLAPRGRCYLMRRRSSHGGDARRIGDVEKSDDSPRVADSDGEAAEEMETRKREDVRQGDGARKSNRSCAEGRAVMCSTLPTHSGASVGVPHHHHHLLLLLLLLLRCCCCCCADHSSSVRPARDVGAFNCAVANVTARVSHTEPA
ncbi:unnamed protein product [Lampetra fluviatilis]